jgi:hypothetical protein
MNHKLPQRLPGLEVTVTTEFDPDLASYVPDGMIRLGEREYLVDGESCHELVAPAGHPVYRTLIGVESLTLVTAHDYKIVGTVHWATPEAIAQSAEIHAEKLARGEVDGAKP